MCFNGDGRMVAATMFWWVGEVVLSQWRGCDGGNAHSVWEFVLVNRSVACFARRLFDSPTIHHRIRSSMSSNSIHVQFALIPRSISVHVR
jgi:hypothetical protein